MHTVDAELLLLVATDRVSAFDVVMGQGVPHKGVVLTQISAWWFRRLEAVTAHHMLTADADEIAAVPDLKLHRRAIAGRTMCVGGRSCLRSNV
jgi:phosphoribosylaminoimidazole-succinocarboxamide synthase